jgi:CRP/FNR family transcriptional regulator, dissimilatory nitrate respiration regulator
MANQQKLEPRDWDSLRRCPLFRHLDEQTLGAVVGRARLQTLERGQTLFAQGDPADAFFIVLDGWVKLYRLAPNGDETVITIIAPGESFAEPVMFLGGKYPVYAASASRCRLVRMEHDAFVKCLQSERELATAMLASIAWRGAALTEQIGMLKAMNAPRRVAEFLLRLGNAGHGGAVVTLPYEKALIAGRLGMTPESFSRALAALKKIGVSVDHSSVEIADVAALRGFVQDGATPPNTGS